MMTSLGFACRGLGGYLIDPKAGQPSGSMPATAVSAPGVYRSGYQQMVKYLSVMPGYSELYATMTGIMYSAGVKPGSVFASQLIEDGHTFVGSALKSYEPAGSEASNIESRLPPDATRDQREAAAMEAARVSSALIVMNHTLQDPTNRAKLKKVIQDALQKQTGISTPLPLDNEGGAVTPTPKTTSEKLASEEADREDAKEKIAGTDKPFDNTTLLLIGGVAVIGFMMMNKKG